VCYFPQVKSDGGSNTFISLAYVHKSMKLKKNLGHFIDQPTTASHYYGFSQTDADTLDTNMRSRYAVNCAPPTSPYPSYASYVSPHASTYNSYNP
jgi:hypothetical protein